MAGGHDHRSFYFPVAHRDLDDVVFLYAQFRQGRAGNDGRVVPAQAGHGLGQFLQPAHVGETAVVDVGIGTEDDFELIFRVGRRNLGSQGYWGATFECGVLDPAGV